MGWRNSGGDTGPACPCTLSLLLVTSLHATQDKALASLRPSASLCLQPDAGLQVNAPPPLCPVAQRNANSAPLLEPALRVLSSD